MTSLVFVALVVAGPLRTAEPAGAVRIICSLRSADGERLEIRIENPSPRPLKVSVLAELALEPDPAAVLDLLPSPSYRAGVDLSFNVARASGRSTILEVPATNTRAWHATLSNLLWHEKVSAMRSGEWFLQHVVPPGNYEIVLVLEGEGPAWWRSNGIRVTVDDEGRVAKRDET